MTRIGLNLGEYLKARRALVEHAIARILPPASMRPAILHKAMRYSVLSGGKRLRPVLCLAAAECVGARSSVAIAPATAIELLHTYTLIHDDLPCMDDDDFRRGKPTCHKKFGEANALLAGDALQALAFETLAATRGCAPAVVTKMLRELARVAGSRCLVGGQVTDLAFAGKPPTRSVVEFIHLHKTADLFAASMRLGAMAGNADGRQLAALTAYGANLGLAFQITDDILDAPDGKRGKQHGELTCLAILSPENAIRKADSHIMRAKAALQRAALRKTEPLIEIAESIASRRK